MHNYWTQYRKTLLLALPIIIAQVGQMLVAWADNMMVGQLGKAPLAAASFANGLFVVAMVFAMGYTLGLTPLVSGARGRKNSRDVARWFKNGLLQHAGVALVAVALLMVLRVFMPYMGQPENVVALSGTYYMWLVASLFPLLMAFSFKQFFEGLSFTLPTMISSLISVAVNILFNWMFIHGNWGAPALGLEGAGVGTFLARIVFVICMVVICLRTPRIREALKYWYVVRIDAGIQRKLFRLSLPMAAQTTTEVLAFSGGTLMVGWINETQLAAHQIILTLVSTSYMVVSGLATATTIQVSSLAGENRLSEVRRLVWSNLHITLVMMTLFGSVFLAFQYELPDLFIKDGETEVIRVAAGLLLVAAIFQISDGVQVIFVSALRGLEDVRIPTLITTVSYLGVILVSGYIFAFPLGFETQGVWLGFLFGLTVASALLLWRFSKLSRRWEQPRPKLAVSS